MSLQQIIKDKIIQEKYITIKDFINLSLFHSKFGYYINNDPIGKNKDFTTSPEISQIFGEIIAFFIVDFWQRKYPNQKVNLVEMGAGHGSLMCDFLRIAVRIPEFYHKININIIEINQKLKEVQKNNLDQFNIKWWGNFNDFLDNCQNLPIFFISNELFDCFAIDQFIFENNIWYQKVIFLEKNKLKFDKIKVESDINSIIPKEFKKNLRNNSIFEQNTDSEEFMKKLSEQIFQKGGIALNIDYGYYENFFQNTLQSIKVHKFNSILENIGQSDLTSHVNFYKLIEISLKNKLNVDFMTQREFLLSNGIELRRKMLLESMEGDKSEINSSTNRLIDSNQMGNLFKVMISYASS